MHVSKNRRLCPKYCIIHFKVRGADVTISDWCCWRLLELLKSAIAYLGLIVKRPCDRLPLLMPNGIGSVLYFYRSLKRSYFTTLLTFEQRPRDRREHQRAEGELYEIELERVFAMNSATYVEFKSLNLTVRK